MNIVNWTLRNKLQWNFNQNSDISFKKIHLKLSFGKWWQFCLGLNVLTVSMDLGEPCVYNCIYIYILYKYLIPCINALKEWSWSLWHYPTGEPTMYWLFYCHWMPTYSNSVCSLVANPAAIILVATQSLKSLQIISRPVLDLHVSYLT